MAGKNQTKSDENATLIPRAAKVSSHMDKRLNDIGKLTINRRRSALTHLNNNASNNAKITSSKIQPDRRQSKTRTIVKKDIYSDYEEKQQLEQPGSLKRSAPDNNLLHQEKRAKVEEQTWDDLDKEDNDDPLMVSEYVVEIFEYMYKLEKEMLPDSKYLTWQKNLQPKMRSILVDWIVEIHMRFRLLPETLYLAINLMDRFLSLESVEIEKFQLLATSCLFIAAKYEEVYSPSVKNYAVVTDGGYTEQEILEAEKAVLEILDFNVSYPNPMNFLRRISKADDYQVPTRTLAKYLMEISIMDHNFIGICPSMAAAAAMYVSRKIFNRGEWDSNLVHYSGGYTEEDLAKVCRMIIRYLISPIIHEEFFKKYASRKYMKVSVVARLWAKKLVSDEIDIMELGA